LVTDVLLDTGCRHDDMITIAALLISVLKDTRGIGRHRQGKWSPLVSKEGGPEMLACAERSSFLLLQNKFVLKIASKIQIQFKQPPSSAALESARVTDVDRPQTQSELNVMTGRPGTYSNN